VTIIVSFELGFFVKKISDVLTRCRIGGDFEQFPIALNVLS